MSFMFKYSNSIDNDYDAASILYIYTFNIFRELRKHEDKCCPANMIPIIIKTNLSGGEKVNDYYVFIRFMSSFRIDLKVKEMLSTFQPSIIKLYTRSKTSKIKPWR